MSDDRQPEVVVVRLDAQSVDDLAHRVADLVHQQRHEPATSAGGETGVGEPGRLLSAAQVASLWGVDRSWVYDHADELGALRLGAGVRPRLRFSPDRVTSYFDSQPEPEPAPPPRAPRRRSRGRHVRRSPGSGADCAEGLPFRPDPELSSTHQPKRPGGAETPPATAPENRTSAR
ncbi:MAG: hypothetical protein JWQ18_2747 [Conexibacter sp.]|nr:hypothetical protein [Conexibacter sp.]